MQTRLEAPARSLFLEREPRSQATGLAAASPRSGGRWTRWRAWTSRWAPASAWPWWAAPGCGKSTLLELVAGLQEPDAGTRRGRRGRRDAAGAPGRDLATCPSATCCCPGATRSGNAALALECQGGRGREARQRAEPLFERFGLAEFERAPPAELSGGMRQRVAFLRTLLPGRPVLLLDEPFAALDAITRAEMQEWLAGALQAEPRTVLLVTHDVEEALYLADRVLVMSAAARAAWWPSSR